MTWSPPKKITVFASFFILILGLALGLIGAGIFPNPPGWDLQLLVVLCVVFCLVSWMLFLFSVMSRGI